MSCNWSAIDIARVLVREDVAARDIAPGDILVEDHGLFGVSYVVDNCDGTFDFLDAWSNGTCSVPAGRQVRRLPRSSVRRDIVIGENKPC